MGNIKWWFDVQIASRKHTSITRDEIYDHKLEVNKGIVEGKSELIYSNCKAVNYAGSLTLNSRYYIFNILLNVFSKLLYHFLVTIIICFHKINHSWDGWEFSFINCTSSRNKSLKLWKVFFFEESSKCCCIAHSLSN